MNYFQNARPEPALGLTARTAHGAASLSSGGAAQPFAEGFITSFRVPTDIPQTGLKGHAVYHPKSEAELARLQVRHPSGNVHVSGPDTRVAASPGHVNVTAPRPPVASEAAPRAIARPEPVAPLRIHDVRMRPVLDAARPDDAEAFADRYFAEKRGTMQAAAAPPAPPAPVPARPLPQTDNALSFADAYFAEKRATAPKGKRR